MVTDNLPVTDIQKELLRVITNGYFFSNDLDLTKTKFQIVEGNISDNLMDYPLNELKNTYIFELIVSDCQINLKEYRWRLLMGLTSYIYNFNDDKNIKLDRKLNETQFSNRKPFHSNTIILDGIGDIHNQVILLIKIKCNQ